MPSQVQHRNACDLGGQKLAQDRYISRHPPPHIMPKPDTQDTNCSPQMSEYGSSRGSRPAPPLVPQQPQPNLQGIVNTRKNATASSSTEPQPSRLANSPAFNTDASLYGDSASSQSANGDGSSGSTRGSGHRRPGSSVDMSGIELPFEITGDEYDLPHSPRTYALLDAVAEEVFDSGKKTPRIPVSKFQSLSRSAQMSIPQRRLLPSGAHLISAIQALSHGTRETQHAAVGKVKTQSTSDHPHVRSDRHQTFPPPGALPVSHQRQVAADARTGPRARDGPFAAVGERDVLNEQMPSLGIDSPTSALTVSSAPEKELTLRDLQDQFNAARAEIGELKVVDRGREQPSSAQRLANSTSQKPGAFPAKNSQLSQSTSQYAPATPISTRPHVATVSQYQAQAPLAEQFPSTDAPWNYSRNIEEVRILAEAWANMHMGFYEQETRTYPEVLKVLLINACGPELVRSLLESKKMRPHVVVRLLFGYIVDCLANTDIFMGFDHDTDRQVANAQNTLNSPFSSTMVRKAALMDLAAVSTHIRGSIRWQEFLQSLFMKHTFELWSIVEPLLPNAVNRSKANADLSVFVRESVKLAGRMVGDTPGQEWTMLFPRVGMLFRGEEMVDRSGLAVGEPTAPHNRNLRVKLSVTPTVVRRGYVGVSIVAEMVHRANVILMG
ncbi:MAG: hypothetical protein M1840_000365 [Geoglossum simile]|nr:MAG: hypothetical protein M1840_000365 [Geoglossum simile]